MMARHEIDGVTVEVWLTEGRLEVLLDHGWVRLRDGFAWRGEVAAGVRRWARECLDDLSGLGPWSHWGRRAGRWTLLASQGPAGGIWTVAYRIGGETITVASGSVSAVESVRCIHGQRTTSEAVKRARIAVEEAVIAWVRSVRRALCAELGEASRSGAAA